MSELMLINQARAATTATIVRAMAVVVPATREINGEMATSTAQPDITHSRLEAGSAPRLIR
jgi:hypothetical protein